MLRANAPCSLKSKDIFLITSCRLSLLFAELKNFFNLTTASKSLSSSSSMTMSSPAIISAVAFMIAACVLEL